MEYWQDQGIVINVRAHGENGAIVSILTQEHGRAAGYVRGARSSKMRGTLEQGSVVDVEWKSRTADGLGAFNLELQKSYAALHLDHALKLSALQAACSLCHEALPEHEAHSGIYFGMLALFDQLDTDVWGAAYILWEIALLKELGFSLDLTRCVGGGSDQALAYVSPKTGKAVSYQAGEPYKDKLLKLPEFLRPQGGEIDYEEIHKGLEMCGYFLERWVFAHHSRGIPPSRLLFGERFAKTLKIDKNALVKEEGHYAAG